MNCKTTLDTLGQVNLAPVGCVHQSAIGVDVHAQILVCEFQCSRAGSNELLCERTRFKTSRSGLEDFARWVCQHQVEVVLMESTGVYWVSAYQALEEVGLTSKQLVLVKASDIKAAKGRKSDKADAARLCEYARMGSFRGSFIPERQIRLARQIGRRLHKAIEDCAREANRFQKQFSFTGSRLSSVFSDTRGVSATKIIDAFLDGTAEDFMEEVRHATRLKATGKEILEAFAPLQDPITKQFLRKQREFLTSRRKEKEDLEIMLEEVLKPYWPLVERLTKIPGIKKLSAMKIVSEIGDDLSAFPNIEAFCSWIGICPGNNESAGKRREAKTPKGTRYLKTYLVEVGQAIGLLKKGHSQLRVAFQAFKEHRGHNRAIVAIAHKVARIIYSMIKSGLDYCDRQCDSLKQIRLNRLLRDVRGASEVDLRVNAEVINLDTGQCFSFYAK